MRIVMKILFTLLVLSLCACSASRISKSELAERKKEEVITALDAEDYVIYVNRAHPFSGSTLTSEYAVKIKDGEVIAYLPYIGQAYYITYDDRGIDFKSKIEDYQWYVTSQDSVVITFKTRSSNEFYRFTLEVFTNGTTYITLTPFNKQAISYVGDLYPGSFTQ